MQPTHYDTLRVSPNAPDEVIHAAFRALAQKYHPDKNTDNPDAGKIMQIINISYKVLSDPHKKLDYDAWLRHEAKSHQPVEKKELTPQEKEAQAKAEKAAAEAAAWQAQLVKAGMEIKEAQKKATEANTKAASTFGKEKTMWEEWAKQANAAIEKAVANEKALQASAAAASGGHLTEVELSGMTHYEILKVAHNAPIEVIRSVHRAWVQKYHPDRNDGNPEAARMLQVLNASYKILSDPDKRAEHDNWLAQKEPKKASDASAARAVTASEKELIDKAEKANGLAAASAEWAEKAAKKAKEAKDKADKARADATAKAKEADAAKWATWAVKLEAEAASEQKQADQAASQARIDKGKAIQAAELAEMEKQHAARQANEHAEAAARERAMWDDADKNKNRAD